MQYTHVNKDDEPRGEDASADENPEEEAPLEDRLPAPIITHASEHEGRDEYDGPGQWSPDPLEPEEYANAEIIPEQDDFELTQLLRKQVTLNAFQNLLCP